MQLYNHQLPPSSVRSDSPKVKKESTSPPGSDSTLHSLEGVESADTSFLLGHLALLFGLLMVDDSANQRLILSTLASQERPAELGTVKLNRLVEQAKDLGAFYRMIGDSGGEEHDDGHISDFNGFVGDDHGRGRKGEDIANEVIAYLERLRDTR